MTLFKTFKTFYEFEHSYEQIKIAQIFQMYILNRLDRSRSWRLTQMCKKYTQSKVVKHPIESDNCYVQFSLQHFHSILEKTTLYRRAQNPTE
jgi:hypothetical protein